MRMRQQYQNLGTLRGRLHEINDGLKALLQRHDLQISVRAAECRRRHLKLSHKCLGLAAKTQVLRNRGYALDGAEEALRTKLLLLERTVFDPALNGRAEEIWARMVSVRERGRQLQREFERAGRGISQGGQVIDEEVMKRAEKVQQGRRCPVRKTRKANIAADSRRLPLTAITSVERIGTDTKRLGGVGGVEASRCHGKVVICMSFR